ncbi:u6 snRNA-associated sm-like protein lsm1 [Chrysochromulina tobinii]|uniref:U6 snRNA-associated Sm-like protein LSm1 n=1 Tax=Chrysochromulina tobinii TaxID=1460289 RepID=A0A0M0LS82_9EUKA|nr:u6 snRNA-associated sm-like protein lsm1 [Chrysochromulina tobinii]|eukprot:KOO53588.1 u6 snRNA-associated sm-like protein lsm1 [Chrysochromulina sp. CCMP291]
MLVQLRDGRKIIGLLRSFDQFANVVLEEAVERIIYEKQFADVPLGLYVIRGENVVLLGEMRRASPRLRQDETKDAHTTSKLLTAAPVEELLSLKREAEEAQRLKAGLSRVARSGMQDAWDLD